MLKFVTEFDYVRDSRYIANIQGQGVKDQGNTVTEGSEKVKVALVLAVLEGSRRPRPPCDSGVHTATFFDMLIAKFRIWIYPASV